MNTLTPKGCVEVRKGLEGFSHAAGGAGARKRGAPTSLSFRRSRKCAQMKF
ncbi:MAG: hypothetical protein LBK61_00420 [Spirochaetaceae bacterium]|nr:hypothetical protein [Spirochaetaceae bacterium]